MTAPRLEFTQEMRRTLDEWLSWCAALPDDGELAAIRALLAERDRLVERLEGAHVYTLGGERKEVPLGSIPDGIECRDETIRLQDQCLTELRAENERVLVLLGASKLRESQSQVENGNLRVERQEWEKARQEKSDALELWRVAKAERDALAAALLSIRELAKSAKAPPQEER